MCLHLQGNLTKHVFLKPVLIHPFGMTVNHAINFTLAFKSKEIMIKQGYC